jgi:pSer/pThr/pTyr-binding forkhead associated (FHA) protein
MAKLVLHGKDGAEREIPLDRQRLTIGRREDSDLCLDDKATSSQHAAIITIGKNSYLQDLKSTNGTLVNGSPVQKHTLKHGDVILIGLSHMSYVDEPDSQPMAAVSGDPRPANGNVVSAVGTVLPAAASAPNQSAVARGAVPLNPESTLNQQEDVSGRYEPWAERVDENAPPKNMVDNMLDAIRSHREQERTLQVRKKDKIDKEWKELVEAAQTLKKRVSNHPRVKFFDIARGNTEILIRIQREGDKTGQHTLLIARQHPHNPSPHETIWLIESGRPDKHCDTAEAVMRDLMNTLAPLIA